ncbi:MAG TPA: hypothetical protein ENI70_00285 [Candidatus Peregrinibacteria bacterium]|nr:hypothetical protein [Candidatus Peregrinibacteria bacterium]
MKVILLAAGRSKRLKPIEDKNFLKFCGKYLVLHQVESLQKAGFTEILVVGSKYNLERLENLKMEGVQVREQKSLEAGMAGAILACEDLIGNEEMMVVSANDVVGDDCFELVVEQLKKDQESGFLVGKKVEKYFPGGYLKTEGDLLTGIIEKPGEGKEPSDLVNLVVHVHRESKQFFEALKKVETGRDDRYEVALDSLLKSEVKYRVIPYEGFWQPIKYPWHILEVQKFFLSKLKKQISKKTSIAKSATIKGEVVIEDGVKVFENAVISGPCYIGKDSIVANSALVRESCLGERCVAGYGTEIARSYLADDVWTHKNYIGDSIIEENCSFGSGTVVGNLRLDEEEIKVNIEGERVLSGVTKLGLICGKNVRAGINISFMPGVKVGEGSFVGAGIVVAEDIEPGTFVTGTWDLKKRPNLKKVTGEERKEFRKKLK